MAKFEAFDPDVEVRGRVLTSVLSGMGVLQKKAHEILMMHGVDNPQPDSWYSQQAWLDCFETIEKSLGTKVLFDIGAKIYESAQWPEGINNIQSALCSINKAYQLNHRGGEIGFYKCQVLDENRIQMTCRNPYPCEFDHGLITSVANRFRPEGVFMVEVQHEVPEKCRKNLCKECIFLVAW